MKFWAQANFCKNSIENLYIGYKINFFMHIWVKQLLNLLAMKFHTKSFFFLGDMDDYIYYQTDRCAQKVGFPRSGHI